MCISIWKFIYQFICQFWQFHTFFRYEANLTAIETDGPYPGYSCNSLNHAYHENGLDSTYHQSRLQAQFYIDLHSMGMYINQPDDYFYFGANKAAMGYNEGQFSLPRWYA